MRKLREAVETLEEIKQRNKELAAINAVAAIVSHSLDLEEILHSALDEVLRLKILGEQMYGMLFLVDEPREILLLAAQRGAPEGHPCLSGPVNVGECLCGLAVQTGEVVVSQNSLEDERHLRKWLGMHLHKDICVPLKARGITLGVMNIRLPGTYEVADNDLRLLKAVADQIGLAIENAQLRELREQAIVEERERIARELHDGFSQLLGYVNTKAMAARLLLQKRKIKAADQQLLQLEEAVKDMFVDVREAILGLKMAGLSTGGLATHLSEFTSRFSHLSGLPVDLEIAPEVEALPIKSEVEYQLVRIVQEALNNVRKHASASQVFVAVRYSDKHIELSVKDDGIGFDPQALQGNQQSHFGLNTMRERARSVGAGFQIDSTPNHGVCVRVCLAVSGDINP